MSRMTTKIKDDGFSIIVAENIEDVEQLREIWERMQWDPYGDIDYYLNEIRLGDNQVRPYAIVLSSHGIPKALLAGRVEETSFEITFGYKVIFRKKVRLLSVRSGAIMGETSDSICAALMSELNNYLRRGQADIVILGNLRLDSCLYRIATTLPGFWEHDHFPARDFKWRLHLGGSFDDYLRTLSRNTRDNLRKVGNRLKRKYGNRLSLKCYSRKEELEIIMRDIEKIASRSWQRAAGVGFVDDFATHSKYEFALNHGWMRVYILYIDDNPVTFRQGLRYGDTYYGEITGMDPKYREDRLGTFLLLKVIENLCSDRNVKLIDFGAGADHAEHKGIFCDERLEGADVRIFRPNIQGAMLNMVASASEIARVLGKSALRRMGILKRLRKSWREHALVGKK